MFVANAITRNKEKAQLGTIALTPLDTKSWLSQKQPQIAKQINTLLHQPKKINCEGKCFFYL